MSYEREFISAAFDGRVSAMEYFFEAGVSIHVQKDYALRVAIQRHHIPVIKFLFKKANPDKFSVDIDTLLEVFTSKRIELISLVRPYIDFYIKEDPSIIVDFFTTAFFGTADIRKALNANHRYMIPTKHVFKEDNIGFYIYMLMEYKRHIPSVIGELLQSTASAQDPKAVFFLLRETEGMYVDRDVFYLYHPGLADEWSGIAPYVRGSYKETLREWVQCFDNL